MQRVKDGDGALSQRYSCLTAWLRPVTAVSMGISRPETGDLLGFPRWETYKVAGKRILAVDDDPSIREMVRDYLVDNDFQVETAASGAEMNAPAT